jgi:hypothetical protein
MRAVETRDQLDLRGTSAGIWGIGAAAVCSALHFLDTSAASLRETKQLIMGVGEQAVVCDFRIICNLFPTYFQKESK